MAHMDIHCGYSVNGVAALHTEILKNSELKPFYDLYPEKFNNKTNGVTLRRWLEACDPELAELIDSCIGPHWRQDAGKLEKLLELQEDEKVLDRLLGSLTAYREALASGDARQLKKQLDDLHSLPAHCCFVNYLRCHDDIGWGLDYGTLMTEGFGERSHKQYLNDYFQGYAGGSVSRGELYNADPVTGDARFCGTTASMCGIEKAGFEQDEEAMERAVRMDVMLHACMFMQSGIPVLYGGDEIGQVNDYTYKEDPDKEQDSRYIHRGAMNWKLAENISDERSVEGRIFKRLDRLERLRKSENVFMADAETWTFETGDQSVLGIGRAWGKEMLLGLFNFSEYGKSALISEGEKVFTDLLSGETVRAGRIEIPAYGFLYLKQKQETIL